MQFNMEPFSSQQKFAIKKIAAKSNVQLRNVKRENAYRHANSNNKHYRFKLTKKKSVYPCPIRIWHPDAGTRDNFCKESDLSIYNANIKIE